MESKELSDVEAYHVLSTIAGNFNGTPSLFIGLRGSIPLFTTGFLCMKRGPVKLIRQICDTHLALSDEDINRINIELGYECIASSGHSAGHYEPRSEYLYLIRNNRNGFTKIGISRDPMAREKTLQSEEPDIELIWQTAANQRRERELHRKYKKKRVRGEWFNLTENDISEITK